MGRPRKTRPPGLPIIKKEKSQVQKNRAAGLAFESYIQKYLTKYLKKRDIEGIVYRLPSRLHYDQPVDLLVDSKEWLYCGIECKSIKDSNLSSKGIKLSDLSREHPVYGHQFEKEHQFLKAGGRFGLVAFKFTSMRVIIFVSHQYIYDKICAGDTHVSVEELLKIGYNIKTNKDSLKLYIQKNCSTV